MKRLTCDDPQDNFLTMMNYVFSKGGWACIRHDGENEDVPLTDWAKAQCAKCEYEISVGDTPQEIDETLCECLMGGEGCPVALAYCFACQSANLRDRLKAIEDILGKEYDLDQLREVKSKINEAQGDGWISVEDRLPETGVPVLIHNPRWDYGVVANYAGEGVWMNTWYQRMTFTPTHWRPLPDQPKEA